MSTKKITGSWKWKQVKNVERKAERQMFRNRERRGTGVVWGTQFHKTYNRKDKRSAKKRQR